MIGEQSGGDVRLAISTTLNGCRDGRCNIGRIGDRLRNDLVARGCPPSAPSRTGGAVGANGETGPAGPARAWARDPDGNDPAVLVVPTQRLEIGPIRVARRHRQLLFRSFVVRLAVRELALQPLANHETQIGRRRDMVRAPAGATRPSSRRCLSRRARRRRSRVSDSVAVASAFGCLYEIDNKIMYTLCF